MSAELAVPVVHLAAGEPAAGLVDASLVAAHGPLPDQQETLTSVLIGFSSFQEVEAPASVVLDHVQTSVLSVARCL